MAQLDDGRAIRRPVRARMDGGLAILNSINVGDV